MASAPTAGTVTETRAASGYAWGDTVASPVVTEAPATDRTSYQTALRMLGALVDEQRGRGLNIVETSGGFVLRFITAANGDEPVMVYVTQEEIRAVEPELRSGRRKTRWMTSHSQVFEATTRYADFLRALGYELDALSANSIAVDDVDGRFVVSYQFSDPRRGYVWNKRMSLVEAQEQQIILERARSRRSQGKQREGGLLGVLAPRRSAAAVTR
jgi:hypothetical protein